MVKSLRSVFGFLYPKMEPTNKKDWVALLSNSIVEGNQSINQNNNLERKIRKNIAYWLMLNLPTWLIYLFIKPRITSWVMVLPTILGWVKTISHRNAILSGQSLNWELTHTHTLFKSVFNCFSAKSWSFLPPFLPVPPLQYHLFHPPLESSALCAQEKENLPWMSTKHGLSSFTKAKDFPKYWAGQGDPVGGAGLQMPVTASEPVSDPTARKPTREASSTTLTYMQSS